MAKKPDKVIDSSKLFESKTKEVKKNQAIEAIKEKYEIANDLSDLEVSYFNLPTGKTTVSLSDKKLKKPLATIHLIPKGDEILIEQIRTPAIGKEFATINKSMLNEAINRFKKDYELPGASVKKLPSDSSLRGAGEQIIKNDLLDEIEETNTRPLKNIPAIRESAAESDDLSRMVREASENLRKEFDAAKARGEFPQIVADDARRMANKTNSVIDAASRFGKKAGKELLGAIPVIGGLASAAMSGDASAGVPILEEAEPVGMTPSQENEMLLRIEEQKARQRYEQSPAGQAAKQRNVMRGPASISTPDGGGAVTETNEDQALRLLGLQGSGTDRAKAAASSYMNRAKPIVSPEVAREPAKAPVAQPTQFVPQTAPAPTPVANQVAQGPAAAFDFNADLPADLKGGLQEQRKAYQQESEIYKQMGAEIAQAEAESNAQIEQEKKFQQQAEDLEKSVAADIDERSRMRLEPKNFFAGKNTWQKIMGGLGLFLSSFSKEGAARFAEAVNTDIELDLKAQESAMLSKDKTIAEKQTLVKQYFDKYKDAKAARLLAKADVFNTIKLRAEAAAASTKSQAAAGAARQAMGLAEAESMKAQREATILLAKKNQELMQKNMGKMVSVLGFEGMAPTEAEAKEFRQIGGEVKNAIDSINQLQALAQKGSKASLEDQAKAETIARLLGASLRTTVLGPGAASDAERELLNQIAANPLKVFSLQSTQLARLNQLKQQVTQNLKNRADILGIQQVQIGRKASM